MNYLHNELLFQDLEFYEDLCYKGPNVIATGISGILFECDFCNLLINLEKINYTNSIIIVENKVFINNFDTIIYNIGSLININNNDILLTIVKLTTIPNELLIHNNLPLNIKLSIFNNYTIAMNKWKTIKFSNMIKENYYNISDNDIILYNKYYNLKLINLFTTLRKKIIFINYNNIIIDDDDTYSPYYNEYMNIIDNQYDTIIKKYNYNYDYDDDSIQDYTYMI